MLQSRNETYAEELALLIRCETISQYAVENGEKFARFHELIRGLFPMIHEKCVIEKFGYSLLFHWKGRGQGDPICLMSHHDVVEASGDWAYPPFSGTIAEGKVWGRGTLDTKGNLWAILRAVEELMQEGYIPERDVYIESACTEETDGSGADVITAELQRRKIRFSLVLDEGGMILHDPLGGCDADFAMIGIGEKSCVDLKFVAKSNGGHASTPPKNSPLVRLGKFMAEADRARCFKAELTDPVVEMLGAFAPHAHGVLKFLFANARIFRKLLSIVMPSVSPTAAALLRTTLAFTQARGSDGSNVLPQEAYVIGNMRISHHQGQKDSLDAIRAVAQKYNVEMIPEHTGIASRLTSTKTDGYRLVANAVKDIFGGTVPTPYIMNAASDSRFFDRVSDCCIRFAPFKIDGKQLAGIHGVNENVDVESLSCAVDFYKYIIQG